MRAIVIEPTFEAWRGRARELLLEGVPPEQVLWSDEAEEPCLFGAEPAPSSPSPPASAGPSLKVSSAFMDLARTTAAHTAASRWGALYRLLWRQTRGGEPHVLALATDPDVRQIQGWAGAVRRDIHKMHAFVRFRLADTDETTGREYFVAWFEPEYRIVPLATPFFKKRFASMDWSILTPHACAHWNGTHLHFTPGQPHNPIVKEDTLDPLWRTYFRSIFNPARLKVQAMQSEMPKKYWKNLPEASLIQEMIATSQSRMQEMLDTEARPARPAPRNAYLESLRQRPTPES